MELVNSRTRAKLYRDLDLCGRAHVTRRSVRMDFERVSISLAGVSGKIRFTARRAGVRTGGIAESIADAARQIEAWRAGVDAHS